MSFISDYLLSTSNNESPFVYHQWSCLSALSAIAGRRFWFNLGPFVYYPNFYTVLVGDPGVKKSAAMDVARDIVRNVGGIPTTATSTTKEAITKEMGHEKYPGRKKFYNKHTECTEEYTQRAIFATEFSTFLGVNPIGMLDFLTAIYSEKNFSESFKNQGSLFFPGPYITMLACMTPETVKGYLKMNILTGGFSRRTMFVFGTRGKPQPFPGNTPEQQAARKRCVEWGKEIQTQSGEYILSPCGKDWYEAWYTENYATLLDRKTSTQAYFGTKHEFLFKTGILFALSESSSREITAAHLEMLNKRFFAPVEKVMDRVFEGAGINPNAAAAAQVCRMLESLNKPMKRKTIEAMFHDQATSISDLRDTINHLINCGRLAERQIVNGSAVIGAVIGTPECMAIHTDQELAALFVKASVPQPPNEQNQC